MNMHMALHSRDDRDIYVKEKKEEDDSQTLKIALIYQCMN